MISKETVEQVARLAKLDLTPTEIESMSKELSGVLNYIDQLNELDVSSVEPLENINEGVEENVLRSDIAKDCLPVDEALKNAPKAADNYFLVPKVLEQEVKSYVETDIAGNEEDELSE